MSERAQLLTSQFIVDREMLTQFPEIADTFEERAAHAFADELLKSRYFISKPVSADGDFRTGIRFQIAVLPPSATRNVIDENIKGKIEGLHAASCALRESANTYEGLSGGCAHVIAHALKTAALALDAQAAELLKPPPEDFPAGQGETEV